MAPPRSLARRGEDSPLGTPPSLQRRITLRKSGGARWLRVRGNRNMARLLDHMGLVLKTSGLGSVPSF
jgi:hypothetical protein